MFIPIPDNTGLVEDYESLYPTDQWHEPFSYVKTSETIEETTQDSLSHGFTYLMDGRDNEWLDKNNEEAHGEGTSAQGTVSTLGTTTRTSQLSAKTKGKEPDIAQPIVISEDEFELVMGLFEKVTHEKTEFLHPGLEQGSSFPPFADYQDTFTNKLSPDMFAAFTAIYPYQKERRIERGDHRIIPTLNYNESDVKDESYICFRLCNAEELFYNKEKVRRPNPIEPIRIVGLRIKSRDNKGDLVSLSAHHDAAVRPKERAATIIAQVDRDHHWEDGIENAYHPQPVAQAQRHFK
ncbi:hypothetical protein V8E53_007964 [Lactarius tabidus]